MKKAQFLELEGLRLNEPLAPYTTWKIGGNASYFWEPTRDTLPSVLQFCHENNIKVYFLGRGSNVLIPDSGLDGLVICIKKSLQNLYQKNDLIVADAGVPMPKLSKFASKLGYGGYEYLIGIPGSVGAGIAINAGLTAHGRREIKDILVEVELLDVQGKTHVEQAGSLDLGYRSSNIIERNLFVLSAKFKFTYKASKEEIRAKTTEHLKERRRKQPLSKPTAGSTFKQPEGDKAAGWYIDKAGLKGHRVGGAVVSQKHANWIENEGDATSEDVRQLIAIVQEKVFQEFSVKLQREVIYMF